MHTFYFFPETNVQSLNDGGVVAYGETSYLASFQHPVLMYQSPYILHQQETPHTFPVKFQYAIKYPNIPDSGKRKNYLERFRDLNLHSCYGIGDENTKNENVRKKPKYVTYFNN